MLFYLYSEIAKGGAGAKGGETVKTHFVHPSAVARGIVRICIVIRRTVIGMRCGTIAHIVTRVRPGLPMIRPDSPW